MPLRLYTRGFYYGLEQSVGAKLTMDKEMKHAGKMKRCTPIPSVALCGELDAGFS
jgi:hypothetical protein